MSILEEVEGDDEEDNTINQVILTIDQPLWKVGTYTLLFEGSNRDV